jgi:hypothetical protein
LEANVTLARTSALHGFDNDLYSLAVLAGGVPAASAEYYTAAAR